MATTDTTTLPLSLPTNYYDSINSQYNIVNGVSTVPDLSTVFGSIISIIYCSTNQSVTLPAISAVGSIFIVVNDSQISKNIYIYGYFNSATPSNNYITLSASSSEIQYLTLIAAGTGPAPNGNTNYINYINTSIGSWSYLSSGGGISSTGYTVESYSLYNSSFTSVPYPNADLSAIFCPILTVVTGLPSSSFTGQLYLLMNDTSGTVSAGNGGVASFGASGGGGAIKLNAYTASLYVCIGNGGGYPYYGIISQGGDGYYIPKATMAPASNAYPTLITNSSLADLSTIFNQAMYINNYDGTGTVPTLPGYPDFVIPGSLFLLNNETGSTVTSTTNSYATTGGSSVDSVPSSLSLSAATAYLFVCVGNSTTYNSIIDDNVNYPLYMCVFAQSQS